MLVAMDTRFSLQAEVSLFCLLCGCCFSAMGSKMQLEIVGLIKDRNFHVAKSIAEVNRCFIQFHKPLFFVFDS